MQKSSHSISVVIPGYNEEANVEKTIARCAAALSALTERYEILIVDDCSTDGMPLKRLDGTRLEAMGWRPKTPLDSGLARTIEAFRKGDRRDGH